MGIFATKRSVPKTTTTQRTVMPSRNCKLPYPPLGLVSGKRLSEAIISQEKIFGPVLAVLKAESFQEALAIANNTKC